MTAVKPAIPADAQAGLETVRVITETLRLVTDKRLELYNLGKDEGEQNNLAAKMPEKVKELHGLLVAWRKQVNAPMPQPNKKP